MCNCASPLRCPDLDEECGLFQLCLAVFYFDIYILFIEEAPCFFVNLCEDFDMRKRKYHFIAQYWEGLLKKQIGTMPAAGCCFIFCPGSTWRAGSQDQVTLFAWTTDINIVYMDLRRCEQTGHHCRLAECLQKQVSSSPKCIAHYNIIHHSMTQWKMLKITVLRMSILIGWW